MSKFNNPAWMDEWQNKHQPLLVEGLTDGPTYVRLMIKELPALDVVLAIRPMVGRITESAIMLGGKLSVFPLKDTLKAAPANEATMANWLKAAFPNVEWPKVSSRRVGTIVATPQTAPYYSGAEYLTAFKQSDTVEKMVAFIEQMVGGEVADRKHVLRAITDALEAELPALFDAASLDKAVETPTTLDTEFGDGDKVVSFAKKKMAMELITALQAAQPGDGPAN